MDVIDKSKIEERRRKKEDRRRKVKEERKNRLKEKSNQQALAKGERIKVDTDLQKVKEAQIEKKRADANIEQISDEVLAQLTFADKIGLIKAISNEIISFPAYRYRKLKDLLKFCQDPKDIDVVLKAVNHLCTVFCDILPSYRIRQYNDEKQEEEEEEVKDNA
jgi:hypothetical protein